MTFFIGNRQSVNLCFYYVYITNVRNITLWLPIKNKVTEYHVVYLNANDRITKKDIWGCNQMKFIDETMFRWIDSYCT